MDTAALTKIAIALGVSYAVYKWAPGGPAVKTAALGVIGVMVAKQIPYVNAAL